MRFSWKHLSINVKFIASILVVFVVFGGIALAVGIDYLTKSKLSETKTLFTDVISSYADNIETVFEDSMRDGQFLAQEIVRWYNHTDMTQWDEYFSRKYYFDQDGAIRTKYEKDDSYGIFVSNIGEFNERVKRLIMATEHKIQVHQRAAGLRLLDTYIIMPEQMILLDDTGWIDEVSADFNFLEHEFFTIALPQNNPERKSAWSSVYYDPLLKYWIISNASPIYNGNDFLGSVGHDVALNGLLATISEYQSSVPDSRHIIISSEGEVIYHPDYKEMMEETPETFNYEGRQDLFLINHITEEVQEHDRAVSTEIVLEDGTRYLLSFAYLKTVDWYYVQLVPRQAVLAEVYSLAMLLIASSISILLFVGVMIYGLTRRMIITPLRKGVEVATQLAEGNLNIDIEVTKRDEIGRLLLAMQRMVAKLKEIVTHVQDASENVASGSEQMSSSTTQMSHGSTEQAAATEQVSSSMEEMTANIRQNADNALQTEKIAEQSAMDARKAGKAVAKSVKAMRKIAKKVVLIEEIASQTRMLSLNATIEAGKTEDHSKGFAVIASEVRKLSEQSRLVAEEINDLTRSGVAIAEKAGKSLSQLVPDIEKTAELVQEISAASREQKSGTEQINKAIQQLDSVTQQHSATSEELSTTAENLANQAEQLQYAMTFFQLENSVHQMPEEKEQEQEKGLHSPEKPVEEPGEVERRHAEELSEKGKGNIVTIGSVPGNGHSKTAGYFLDLIPIDNDGDERDTEFERY